MADRDVAALFAGIGGIESGLHQAGLRTVLLCECWEPAVAVLGHRFEDVPLELDVARLRALPSGLEVVTAGFPCQDLSQAGKTAGISGERSGLVGHVFRLVEQSHPRWLVLENVPFMLQLDQGKAMSYLVAELERMGYRWAYRVVDSRFSGVPQRRRRVLLVASRTEDPRAVLFTDDAGEPQDLRYRGDAFGFYWTEGLRGLGWARDATPTLKGGSAVGIPSPPAIWIPTASAGRKIVTPTVEDSEALQGFPRGWTEAAHTRRGDGIRMKLTGNAVTVGVSRWLGERLRNPGRFDTPAQRLTLGAPWPAAAYGGEGGTWQVFVSEYPTHATYTHLLDLVDRERAKPLSIKAASGFFGRAMRAKLRFDPRFLEDVAEHIRFHGGDPLQLQPDRYPLMEGNNENDEPEQLDCR